MNDITILIVTCDKRAHLWVPWNHYFSKHWDKAIPSPKVFSTESISPPFTDIPLIFTGVGDWSDRVRWAIKRIRDSCKTVFLLQEDFWPCEDMTKDLFQKFYNRFLKEDLLSLKICRPSKYYKLDRGRWFHPKSKYLMNHQPGFWKKDFLSACMHKGETPWSNELLGTERLWKQNLEKRIGIEQFSWYVHACKKGNLTEEGKWHLSQMKRGSFSRNS